MRILVLGASGFIGRHLATALRERGDEVIERSLRDPRSAAEQAAGIDVVVNLAGESISQRWSSDAKQRIMQSRTLLPEAFFSALAAISDKPAAYVSASAVGYYGTSEEQTFTESSSPGNDFLAEVCVAWERTAMHAQDLGMRVSIVRCGLVLGTDGGALAKILPIFKAGTGGRVGSGKQWYSWIHIDDAVGIYMMAIDGAQGTMNATAPNPVRNQEFTNVLSHALNRPAALPVPAFALKVALGQGAMLVLEGQRVLPQRALADGYSFKFPALESALTNLVSS